MNKWHKSIRGVRGVGDVTRVRRASGAILFAIACAFVGCGVATGSNGFLTDGGGGTPPATGGSDGGTSSGGNSDSSLPPSGEGGGGGLGLGPGADGGDGATGALCGTLGSTQTCCNNGIQICKGNEFHSWGPCVSSNGAPLDCAPPEAGCATNEFGGGCDAGVDAPPPPPPPPPPGKCGTGMECIPGSIRYCDDNRFSWSKQTCDPTGHWGQCMSTAIPAKPGCDSNYAPDVCCTKNLFCCQWEVNGPFVDFGGACAAISCKP